ncbi:hypothetical protein CcaverHIS002_0605400 [Cutaneotrichosporon cavernicola]|uniref:Lon protease homolog, mitochondrial n=1 Tax=Cutaneotrichosporon cavernicola TaxID=279322 RepID=A0AA48L8E6_9TREE|nr:uncharacterized protein CcaverHIS019_0604850 [Cutaneotrichosporon cavernicola]BEI86253.1 hypothetical protein CcaverHIS002_0605400 [Cutaneotrichosporon cavernicola]BEI94026.1 hypothetical protein CcaverHIS019_0604850 [Cutaneotrichosporon cavernicola]BEJ01806.1 hypothetical protein CcaverHIS631_0604880 [Cutaneotrichosporon cavernicola]BEJ09571.1 hypothetical protein CcaverHIS641_0604860 [Cutaneotrichosporon cavernicola]
MLPFRAAARTAPRRVRAAAPAALRAATTAQMAGPSRLASDYMQHSRPPLSRALHATRASFKDKRWVNSALKDGKEANEEDGKEGEAAIEETTEETKEAEEGKENKETEVVKEDKDKVEVKEGGTAESSKDAEKRAKSSGSSTGSSPLSSSKGSGGASPPPPGGKGGGKEIAKPSIPEVYPQVLALPITRRPLFPGFYKAVTITSPAVIKAIRDLISHGQPYIGAFLLKDSDSDSDVITSVDQVHPVGVFAQITSVFSSADQNRQPDNEDPDKPETLTAVLYPHRRIHIDELVTPSAEPPAPPVVPEVTEPTEVDHPEAEVASFEKDVPSVEETREALHPEGEGVGKEAEVIEPSAPQSQIGFLHPLVPEISLTNVTNLDLEPYKKDSQVVRAIMGEILAVFKEIAQLQPIFREQIASFTMSNSAANVFDEPDKLADFAAAVSTGDVHDLQSVLESLNVEDRLQKALLILKKELINAQLQSKISRDVESKIQKRQREYYLMEQLKGIKKELGMESDGKDKLVERFKEKASKLSMPEGVKKVFDEELNKLVHLEPAASEFNVTRNYLDWLTQIPWGVHSPENFNIANATKVLDEDHYGLKDVKDRILEFLAVGKLRGTVEGKIICLSGPPGVGKTSIGKSIARALGRQFFRFSVGGLTDVAEIKGHRRTYIGAMPGKPIQALKKVAVENPLILIDEIDKLGRGHNGDPASALLEMLDPEQNSSFLDHYMDVPVDLSRVLFVCTANVLDTIPAPLLDRMEVIEVNGYVQAEKVNIADKYLSPQAKEANGLKDVDIDVTPEAIETLIRWYCRESGVRNLKKHIDKIYRKAAFKIVEDLGEEALPEPTAVAAEAAVQEPEAKDSKAEAQEDSKPAAADETTEPAEKKTTTSVRQPLKVPEGIHISVGVDNLKDYVGPPVYHKDRLYNKAPPAGVSTGLGYLGNGSGSVMPIEVTSMPGKGGLQLTGKLGEVIRESAQIALSWVKSNAFLLGITKSEADLTVNDRDIHLHMPEGGIGKEGPSAGTAILTAFVSLLTKTPVDPDVAMTGEISLHGQVLPVGGLKEKILAAHRAGIKKLVVPLACKSDIDENVPVSVKEGIEFVFVDDVRQVLAEVFRGSPAAERWLETLPSEAPVRAVEEVQIAASV